jgi:hypothetical protein
MMSMVHLACVCSAMVASPHAGRRTRDDGDGRRRRGCLSHPLVPVPSLFILIHRHARPRVPSVPVEMVYTSAPARLPTLPGRCSWLMTLVLHPTPPCCALRGEPHMVCHGCARIDTKQQRVSTPPSPSDSPPPSRTHSLHARASGGPRVAYCKEAQLVRSRRSPRALPTHSSRGAQSAGSGRVRTSSVRQPQAAAVATLRGAKGSGSWWGSTQGAE